MPRFTLPQSAPIVADCTPLMNFLQLTALAEAVVTAARRRLPAPVRTAAEQVPVCYEPHLNAAILAEGWEPDILGLFVGHEHRGELTEGTSLPPQILLFLENLWDYAEGDEAIYRDEVRLT